MDHIIIDESCSTLRALGREALRGNWTIAVIATLVFGAVIFIPAFIFAWIFPGISYVYSLLVSGPLTLGYTMFVISLFRKRNPEVAQVFYGFENFGKALGLMIVMSIFIYLWSLLLFVPGVIAAIRYSQAFLILADYPELGIMECIERSKQMMVGNKMKYFLLSLSFIGWALLCAIPVVGWIGYLWLGAYIELSLVGFYEILNGNLRPGTINVDFEIH